MADIQIVKRRDRATMFSQSFEGKKWMMANLIYIGPIFSFNSELIEDMVQEIEKADLSVEVI